MTAPKRRAPTLSTTFTPDEVRLLLAACDSWAATNDCVPGGPNEHVMLRAQTKLLKLRAKARKGGT